MNALSAEVLINIFAHLHFVQKLECLLVCRKWAQIPRDGYIFETIHVASNSGPSLSNELRTITLRKSKCSNHPGKKCKRFLSHPSWLEGKLDIVTLATTYPNRQKWIKQGVFNRLSTLIPIPSALSSKDDCYDELFSYFSNLPALTHLTIYEYTPHISHLEIIHSNAPGLTPFTLKRAPAAKYVNLQSLNVKPAEKLTRLCLDGIHKDLERCDTLLEYIKLKYTHLDEFVYSQFYNGSPDWQRNERVETECTELISIIGPGLNTYAITGAQHTSAIPNLLAKYITQLENLSVDVYQYDQILNAIVPNNTFCNLNSLSLKLLPKNLKLSCLIMMVQLKTLSLDLQIKGREGITISLNGIASKVPKSTKSLTLP